jgi:hypothetical protein
MASDAARTKEFGDAIGRDLVAWLHRFRSIHGEVYAVALVLDSSALRLRAVANTEAHYRQSIAVDVDGDGHGDGDVPDKEHERRRHRWSPAHWVSSEIGPDFRHTSGVLAVTAWQPSFESFRSMVIEAMYRGVRYASSAGALGDRRQKSQVCVFLSIDDPEMNGDLQRTSAREFNTESTSADLLRYLGV